MGKLFSNEVTFQIAVATLALLLANTFTKNRGLKNYAYKSVGMNLEYAIYELEYMNAGELLGKKCCRFEWLYSNLQHFYIQ